MAAFRARFRGRGHARTLANAAGRAAAVLGILVACQVKATAQVAVMTQAPDDHDVAEQLRGLIDAAVVERAGPVGGSVADVIDEASSWPEVHVVVIDRPRDAIHVVRPRDRTTISRVLAAEVMLHSQYAVALASAELLEWLGVLPAAHGRPTGLAPRAAVATRPDLLGEDTEHSSALGWAAGIDFELATSPGFDVSLARPSASGEVQLGRLGAPLWFALGARVSAPAQWDRELDPSFTPAGIDRVRYSEFGAGLHAAIGVAAGPAAMAAQLEGGGSLVRVRATVPSGARVGEHDGPAGWVGIGLGLRYAVLWGISVAAGVQGQWLVARATYRVEGTPVLREGPIRIAARIGLIWESALFPGIAPR